MENLIIQTISAKTSGLAEFCYVGDIDSLDYNLYRVSAPTTTTRYWTIISEILDTSNCLGVAVSEGIVQVEFSPISLAPSNGWAYGVRVHVNILPIPALNSEFCAVFKIYNPIDVVE
jgi:hypothetical protein